MKDADKSPLEIWKQALENITPQVEVKSKRIGGATFQVPTEVRPERKISISMKNLVLYSRKRAGKSMADEAFGQRYWMPTTSRVPPSNARRRCTAWPRPTRRSHTLDSKTGRLTDGNTEIYTTFAISVSWLTSTPVRPLLRSVSFSTRARPTRSARRTKASAVMDWMAQEQERGITITSAATTAFWNYKDQPVSDQPDRHSGTRRLHRRGGAFAARAGRRRGYLLRRGRRGAPVGDRLASGRQIQRAAYRLRQQDGPHGRRLLRRMQRRSRSTSALRRFRSFCRSVRRTNSKESGRPYI